ncbi:dentin sialophosphoprotein-like protein [Actinidia rufa]|uniref:Dentin sialophosphoprotein-like protein n=1 Tax=Actinidia rufa TaxID=165716 RepID=A0A7J0FFV2_9ERIC|nr:dentin sialophosphoprotein-like protein [Actinidia rufa]
MEFQIPTDLIRQVQISLRNHAGLSSYDPDDPTLPALPSLRQVVTGLDPSPPYLRCKHCQGRLLRGLQSVICVYCGNRQQKDVPPDPIAFKSTFGYQWLLQSLDLDESGLPSPRISYPRVLSKEPIAPLQEISPKNQRLPSKDPLHRALEPPNEQAVSALHSLKHGIVNLEVAWSTFYLLTNENLLGHAHSTSMWVRRNHFDEARASHVSCDSQICSLRNSDLIAVADLIVIAIVIARRLRPLKCTPSSQKAETVGPPIDEIQRNRGQNTPKDEVSLSDLLDLEIPWPPESEKTEHSLATNNVPGEGKSSLYLVGVDLDNFFVESKRDLVSHSSEEKLETNRQSDNVEMNAFSSQENISLFQNVHQSATTFGSSEVKDNDGFTGWEADFQSADSGNQSEASRSFDTVVGSTVDLSAQLDSVFGPGKDLEDEKPRDTSFLASATNDWIQDDPWDNSNFLAPHQAEQVDITIKSMDSVTEDNLYTPTSIEFFPDDQRKTSSTTAPDKKIISEDDDSFDVWNDFTSSTSAQDPFKNSSAQVSSHTAAVDKHTSDTVFSSSTNFQEMDFGSFSQPDLFSGSLGNQSGSVGMNDMRSEVPATDRLADAKAEGEGNVGQTAKDGDIFKLNHTVRS